MKHLKHISKYRPFNEDDYIEWFQKEWDCQLVNIEYKDACKIYGAFRMLPDRLVKDTVDQIAFEPGLGTSDKYFPNHGEWDNANKIMYLNQDVFKNEGDEFLHLVLHEFAHALDCLLGNISTLDEDWLDLSGWTEDPPGITPLQKSDDDYLEHGKYVRLKIKEDNLLMVADWWHLKNAKFVRWYAGRNPMEDLAESFSYYVLGDTDRFTGCHDKADYIKEKMLAYKKKFGE